MVSFYIRCYWQLISSLHTVNSVCEYIHEVDLTWGSTSQLWTQVETKLTDQVDSLKIVFRCKAITVFCPWSHTLLTLRYFSGHQTEENPISLQTMEASLLSLFHSRHVPNHFKWIGRCVIAKLSDTIYWIYHQTNQSICPTNFALSHTFCSVYSVYYLRFWVKSLWLLCQLQK